MIVPIAQAYVGDISPEGEEGTWMGYFNSAFFSGFGFGPLLGVVLTDHFGMNVAFSTMSGLNLLAFLIVAPFLPKIRQTKTTTGSSSSFRRMSSSSMVRGIFSFRLADALGRGSFVCFMPVFAGIYLGLSPTLIGILLAVNILLSSLFQPFSGKIADRFNRRALVILGSVIRFAFLALLPSAHNFGQLLGLCVFGALGAAIALPAASALIVKEGRKFGMGSTMAMFTVAMSIGMATGPLLGGVVADFADINSVFYFAAGMILVGISLFTWFTR